MAFSTLRTNLSGLFKTKSTGVGENPQFYLKLTTKCMKQAHSMVASTSLKFNHEQCKYLAHKLKEAVRSAQSFYELISTWYSNFATVEDRARSLGIFKLLFTLSKEVETFHLCCSKDEWVQSAILLSNVSEHIVSLGFHLEFCTILLSNRRIFGAKVLLTDEEISRLRKAEADIVQEMSHLDHLRLHKDVRALVTQSRKPGSADLQHVSVLLERLKSPTLNPSADLLQFDLSSRPVQISISSLKQVQVLGTGSFGDVHKANWLGFEVARKTFHGSSALDFEREVQILEGLSHPNIVSLLWYTRDERKCYMIMELMDGDLYSLMQERLEECGSGIPPFSISEAVHMMLQVAEGMLFLHEKQIVHRDLKSRNILVRRVKATEDLGINYVYVKVADFGLSKTKEKSMTYSNQTLNQGTTRWMAPEMIKLVNEDGQVELEGGDVLRYPFKVDVYSFGMVCLEILTGDMPFPGLTPREVKRRVLDGDRPRLPDDCPNRLRSLIEACWSPKPDERPRFDYICAELRHLKCAHFMNCAWTITSRCFSLEEIKRMTNDFNKINYIGSHVSGEDLYMGAMVDTGEVVAVNVKLSAKNSKDEHANESFKAQMKVLPRLHHNNVVRFAGFCLEKGEGILVFEYMPNGSLDKWLFEDVRKVNMTWPVRRNICLGVANGIHYLHSLSQPRIVHRDIRPCHILLDQNLEPKVADFSFTHLLPDNEVDIAAESTLFDTPFRYIAPEQFAGRLSQKCDVYSFGVVLLEIVRGRRAFDLDAPLDQMPVVHWALERQFEGRVNEFIDPTLDLQPHEEIEAGSIINIALLCTLMEPEIRPDMEVVVAMLQRNLDATWMQTFPDCSFSTGL